LNTTQAPLDDEKVRQALSLAIDRDALAHKVLRDGQQPAYSLTPPGMPHYTPPHVLRTDLAEAKRLLAETAFGRDGATAKIELLYNTSDNLRLIAEALQQMWQRDLGIHVELLNQEYKVVLSERRAGHYQMILGDWVGDYLDASTFLDPWRSSSPNNFTGWSDSDYDASLFAAEREPDAATRADLMAKAERRLLEAAPVIPLYYNPHTYLLQTSVRGWHPTLLDRHPYKAVWLQP
jgi:oligopeptide transport system substrate-binding protein